MHELVTHGCTCVWPGSAYDHGQIDPACPHHGLMSREEVAALLNIDPESVRNTLRREGITEQRGYPRKLVLELIKRRQVPIRGSAKLKEGLRSSR